MSYRLSELKVDQPPQLLEGIETDEQWSAKRERIKRAWLELLGEEPEIAPSAGTSPKPYEVIGKVEEADHTRLDIRYPANDGDTIGAYLLLPRDSSGEKTKRPAVLALHPTAESGRRDTATKEGRDNRRYGLELVSRGYVVLAPDSIGFGSRIYPGAEPFQTAPFYERYPKWTAVGRMLSDHRRALDVLGAVEEADPARIGVIGHSLGGYNGWFLAGLDERVRAVVSSCGFAMFAGDPEPNRWGQREWFSHFPAVTIGLQKDTVPFEWHEIAALAAPVPLFMWSGMDDRIFPNAEAIVSGMKDLGTLYKRAGASEAFQFWLGAAGHDFPGQARELAYTFLDRWLGHQ
ncbi:alpha/beta fold hydrolase [Paenibacillus sp. CC-CFT747]|nr:alpha/beta fold hydrolase [Paenibacillus sp. CC-CFT747]